MTEPTINTAEELRAVLSEITLENSVLDFKWKFDVRPIGDGTGFIVCVTFERPDTQTGKIGRGRGRDEIIWAGATVSGVVKTAWLLIELMVRHELMEGFRWRGARIFNPHHRVDDLAAIEQSHQKGAAT